jgi:hypothetical protein
MDKITDASLDAPAEQEAPAEMRAVKKWGGYNEKRYGKPWIAKVIAWPIGGRPELQFGGYVGDDDGGELEILARPGQIVKYGQKDHRNSSGTANYFGIVEDDGKIRRIKMVEARALFIAPWPPVA